ncbi:MAG: M48 family metalloprotease [Burkholderiaceae bacterium]
MSASPLPVVPRPTGSAAAALPPHIARARDRLARAVAIGALAVVLAVVLVSPGITAPVHAQANTLPSLGDAGGSTLSPGEEREVGERIMRDLTRSGSLLDDIELTQYLNEFAARLVNTSAARGHSFEFFLVRDPSLNAFALPGGYVGVHTGLLLGTQTESELASVLAHEIGHVTQRHIARMLEQNRQSSLLSMSAVLLAILAATADPQAAGGLVALGGSVHEQQMLSFSRDAEREADRVGLEILRDGGFDTADMVAFFERLQRATRVYDRGAPSYLRTHPLTTERMADIRNRIGDGVVLRHPDGLGFHLARAKAQALASSGSDGLRSAREAFQAALDQRSYASEIATWYGMATVQTELNDLTAAREALARARRLLPADASPGGQPGVHPFFESLQARLALQAGDVPGALAAATEGARRFPGARALTTLRAELMVRLGRHAEALGFLEDQLQLYRGNPELWRLLAQAHAGLGQTGLAHVATGEQYALLGGWAAALNQMRLAQQDRSLNFYDLARIDTRIRTFEAALLREREDR